MNRLPVVRIVRERPAQHPIVAGEISHGEPVARDILALRRAQSLGRALLARPQHRRIRVFCLIATRHRNVDDDRVERPFRQKCRTIGRRLRPLPHADRPITKSQPEIVGWLDHGPSVIVLRVRIQHAEGIGLTPGQIVEEIEDAPIGQQPATTCGRHGCAIDLQQKAERPRLWASSDRTRPRETAWSNRGTAEEAQRSGPRPRRKVLSKDDAVFTGGGDFCSRVGRWMSGQLGEGGERLPDVSRVRLS